MKRRKTYSKYTIGEQGQITNNEPTLSPKTQKLFQFMGMMEMFSGYMSELKPSESNDDESTDVVETVVDTSSSSEGDE